MSCEADRNVFEQNWYAALREVETLKDVLFEREAFIIEQGKTISALANKAPITITQEGSVDNSRVLSPGDAQPLSVGPERPTAPANNTGLGTEPEPEPEQPPWLWLALLGGLAWLLLRK